MRLRRKRAANDLVWNHHLETIVALDAGNPVAALLCAITGSDVNLLLSFTSGAFYRHDDVLLGFHSPRISNAFPARIWCAYTTHVKYDWLQLIIRGRKREATTRRASYRFKVYGIYYSGQIATMRFIDRIASLEDSSAERQSERRRHPAHLHSVARYSCDLKVDRL